MEKMPLKKSSDCVCYIYFYSFENQLPPVSHLKFPTPCRLPMRRPPFTLQHLDSSVKLLALCGILIFERAKSECALSSGKV